MQWGDAPAYVEHMSDIARNTWHPHGRKLNRILEEHFIISSQLSMYNLLQLSCHIWLKVDSDHAFMVSISTVLQGKEEQPLTEPGTHAA